ncbi:tetratricopeptide repeat protein [Chondromyces crocatus]|nr:tetratricopeptide repeat protein [Chondromyces crocatus]
MFTPEDARAYERFVTWSEGAGFRLAVVELSLPRDRDALLRWTQEAASGVQTARLDGPGGLAVWDLLKAAFQSAGETRLLMLTHLEAAADRKAVCAQLNIQRDELTRAFAVPWILVLHPSAALDLQRHAPDLCDFATLWLKVGAPDARARLEETSDLARVSDDPLLDSLPGDAVEPLLAAAHNAAALFRIDEARDLLARYDMLHPDTTSISPHRSLIEARLLNAQGQPLRAMAILEEAHHRCKEVPSPLHSSLLNLMGTIQMHQGDLGRALALHEDALQLAINAKDASSQEVARRGIALILMSTAEIDRALSIFSTQLATFEQLGDIRARAITLGDIARILVKKGDIDKALALHQERLLVFEQLGNPRETAAILWQIARIHLSSHKPQPALETLARAYAIVQRAELLEGISVIGIDMGKLLCATGAHEEGLAILERSRSGFEQLGRTDRAQQTADLIASLRSPPDLPPAT